MDIENPYLTEIKGTLTYHIHRISHLIQLRGNQLIKEKEIPIDMDQLPVLMCVFFGDNISQQEVASVCNRDKAYVKRTLTVFEKKGLIKILPHPKDKRKTIVQTTDVGNFVTEQIREMIYEAEKEMFSFLNNRERKELLENLQRILSKVEISGCGKM
jgi:DNA-binding MarR family transcriptional regulator